MDALLAHAYVLAEDAHEQGVMKPYPPLGILYVAAYLRREGFDVGVVDPTFGSRAALHARLALREAPVLGLYVNLTTRASALDLAAAARSHGWRVVLGGPEPANHAEAYLEHGADVVVFGEGEETMAELLPALARRGPNRLHPVAGLAFRDEDGTVVRTAPRPKIADLDALPWPAREAIDIEAYLACWRAHHGAGSLNLITARGCPYRCRWCSHAVFGYHHARRSPDDVAAEVSFLRERYAPERLWFADDVFTIHPGWLRRFARAMSARGPVIPFECITRADRVDEETVALMRQLGCYRVWLGSESGSQRVLDAMERGVRVEAVRSATRRFQDAGIAVGMFLMWGYDGETADDIEATIDHARRTLPDVVLTTVAYPIAGTPYAEAVADRAVATRPWAEGTDRDVVVRGRPSPRYYRAVTRRLHHEVAAARLRRDRPRAVVARARATLGALAARAAAWRASGEVEA